VIKYGGAAMTDPLLKVRALLLMVTLF